MAQCGVLDANLKDKGFHAHTKQVLLHYAMNPSVNSFLDSPITIYIFVGGVTTCITPIRSQSLPACI